MIVERYQDGDAPNWDAFVRTSGNGTFLFQRGYMDHHRDRFPDHSFLIRNAEGELVSLLPAHAVDDRLISHGGLSYGGLVLAPGTRTPCVLRQFETLLLHVQRFGFRTLDYKTIPHIYPRHPAEADRYALARLEAKLVRRDLLSVIAREDRLPYQVRRSRGIKKARAERIVVGEETDFSEYWDLLTTTLAERHAAVPVHSLPEIAALAARFPANIRLFTARTGELLAGVVIYESDRVAHAQYIAASPAGRSVSALDLLFDYLLTDVYASHPYFDLGGSHEDGGRAINVGLIEQKEGFGARSVVHDQYRIDLTGIEPGVLTGALR